MSPDRLAVNLRPRSGWEAIDLGFQLARQAARPLFVNFSVLVICITLLTGLPILLYAPDWAEWAWLPMWWLKPLYDRMALFSLSRAVFGEPTRLVDAMKALPTLLFRTSLFSSLSWRRIGSFRTIRLPVDQLEGLRGAPARARRTLLGEKIANNASSLMYCCMMFELVITLSLYTLLLMMLPDGDLLSARADWLFGDDTDIGNQALLTLIFYTVAVIVVEPFYIAGGFGLYLKRRTDLEAWDVEMQLRSLPQGKPAGHPAARNLACLTALAVALLALPPSGNVQAAPEAGTGTTAGAEAAQRREASALKAQSAIQEVMARPEFGAEETVSRLRWRAAEEESSDIETPGWFKSILNFWRETAVVLAKGIRTIAWGVLLVVAVFLVVLLARQLRRMNLKRRPPPPPGLVAGLDIRPESLPEDIAASVAALLAAERTREALALLYRASLSRLAHRERIPFERGDTEGDCLRRVTQAQSPACGYFERLTLAWEAVAYAQQAVARAEAESLRLDWQSTFASVT